MEVEYGGIKATGGKLFVILSLLGTIGGGLWGGLGEDSWGGRERIACINYEVCETFVSDLISL